MVPYVSIYIVGVFLVFVSTITAMSLWVSFSMDFRLVVLPVIPFAFVYSIFMCCWSWLLLFILFLFLLLFLGVALSGWVVIVFFCFGGFDLLGWFFFGLYGVFFLWR